VSEISQVESNKEYSPIPFNSNQGLSEGTNESLTSLEEDLIDSFDSSLPADFQYSPHKTLITIPNHLVSSKIFEQIITSHQEGQRVSIPTRRKKKQISIQYKNYTEELKSVRGNKKKQKENEGRKSLTCRNPILIQDLEVPIKNDMEELRLENLELKQKIKQQQILFDSKKHSLKYQKEALVQELAKYNTRVELLEEENLLLVKHNNTPLIDAFTSIDQEIVNKFRREREVQIMPSVTSISTQTEGESKLHHLKQEVKNYANKLTKYKNEHAESKELIHKLQKMLTVYESERNESEKKRLAIAAHLQATKYKYDLDKKSSSGIISELRLKILNLEAENKVLGEENGRLKEEITIIDEQPEVLKEMTEKLSHYEELYTRFARSSKDNKKLAEEYRQKLNGIERNMDSYKGENSKLVDRIRELKREIEQLKMENLKQRQLFTEKCKGYKEIRIELRKKLKQKDDMLLKLQKKINAMKNYKKDIVQHNLSSLDPEIIEAKIFSRPKSLENTGVHYLKDLGTTIQFAELPIKLKKKFGGVIEVNSKITQLASERTTHNKRGISHERINNINPNVADKSKSFCFDEASTGMCAKNVLLHIHHRKIHT
jgi:hypothetical protein